MANSKQYVIIKFMRFLIILTLLFITDLQADEVADINIRQQTDQNIQRQNRNLNQATPFQGGAKINTQTKQLQIDEENIGRCFTFTSIEISGNTIISQKKIKAITSKYLNKCIAISIAQEYLLEEIVNLYQKDGYILAVPYLPEQNLTTGVLKIIIAEGILEDIEFDSDILPKRVVNMAFFGMRGKIINIRHLEQALENLNKFGAVSVNMDLKPGNSVGSSILVLRAEKQQQFNANVRYDNEYNSLAYLSFPNVDNHKLSTSLSYAHLLGNDNLMLNANTTLITNNGNNQQGSLGVSYAVPFGFWDFIYNINYDISRNVSRMIYDDYVIRTSSITTSMDIKRTLARGQQYILKAIARPNYYTTDTYLDDIRTAAGYELYFLDLGLEYQYFSQKFIVYSNLTYTRGQPLFGLEKQGRENNQYLMIPQNMFDIGKLIVNTTIPITNKVYYTNKSSAQYSSDILYTINDFIVVSPNGVRGYEGVYANYNSGFVSQNDINVVLFNFSNQYINGISTNLGFDAGAAIDGYNGKITHDKVLMGWALGVKTNGKIELALSYARPINHIYIPKNHEVIKFSMSMSL
jgi:hemolysin activation/secretion protein